MSTEALIEVRIRHDSEETAVRLCDWPAQDLDSLLELIQHWDLYSDGEYVAGRLGGQFRYDSGEAAYYEYVIAEDV